MTLLARAAGSELMDDPDQAGEELAHSLTDLRGVNRWLGGTRSVLKLMRSMTRGQTSGMIRVLDVATGGADIPLALAAWARARGLRPRIAATDFHAGTLAVARRSVAADPDIIVLIADARALPFADDSFDFSLCCTALHHFDEDDAVRVLRELARVAESGVIVTDLRRSRAGLLGARVLAATVWRRHPVTRHDGPLSVRRAYTAVELLELARAAGWRGARVRRHPFFRISLVLDKSGGAG